MDKRLLYDPNVNLTNYNTYQEPMNNYIPNNMNTSANQMSSMQQQLPQIQQMQQPIIPPNIMQEQYNVPENYKYNLEKMSTNNNKSKFKEIWNFPTLRKIFIITLLYVIISHNKTSLLLCNKIPYICITNALSYNIFKGVIFSLIIIITWSLL